MKRKIFHHPLDVADIIDMPVEIKVAVPDAESLLVIVSVEAGKLAEVIDEGCSAFTCGSLSNTKGTRRRGRRVVVSIRSHAVTDSPRGRLSPPVRRKSLREKGPRVPEGQVCTRIVSPHSGKE